MKDKIVRPLRFSDFAKFWTSDIISSFGSQLTAIAFPLTAVLILNATPVELGLIGTLRLLPSLLLNLFVGVWIDRLPRRPVLIATNLALGLTYGSLPVAYALGFLSIGFLYVVVFLSGSFSVVFYVAYQAFLPGLVPKEDLTKANSRLETTNSVATIAGPWLGGTLVQLFAAPLVIALDAASYFVSAFLLVFIRHNETPQEKPAGKSNIFREISEGLQVVFGNKLLRAIVGCTATGNFSFAWIFSIYTLYAVRVLKFDPATIGLISGVSSIGALVGAVLAGRIARRFPLGMVLFVSNILIGLGTLAIPLASGPTVLVVATIIAGQFLASVMILVYQINQISIRQALVPARLQGRASASTRFVAIGVGTIGALLGGFAGDIFGLQTALLVGAVIGLLSCLWILFSPLRSVASQASLLNEASKL